MPNSYAFCTRRVCVRAVSDNTEARWGALYSNANNITGSALAQIVNLIWNVCITKANYYYVDPYRRA